MSPAELFSLPFMQRALIAALFTGLAAPAVGAGQADVVEGLVGEAPALVAGNAPRLADEKREP